MKQPNKNKTIFENYSEIKNPELLDKVVIPVNVTKVKNQFLFENDEVTQVGVTLEATHYTKVFRTPTLRKEIAKLESCSRDLYLWMIYSINPGRAYIDINRERYMHEMSVSPNTYRKAVTELIAKEILFETSTKNKFMVNPTYFFCGNRISKFRSKTKSAEDIKNGK